MDKLCEDENCEIKSCLSRHPKACRYFSEFKMCKFGEYCHFTHKVSADDSKCEMEDTVDKVETIEKVLSEHGIHMEKHKAISTSMHESIQNLTLELEIKDDEISDLKSKVESLTKAIERIIKPSMPESNSHPQLVDQPSHKQSGENQQTLTNNISWPKLQK